MQERLMPAFEAVGFEGGVQPEFWEVHNIMK